jgi:hypothetical protein
MSYDEKEVWRGLTYSLLYLGILGSMLFDIFDPLRPRSLTQIALIAIGLTYVFDYLHLRFNLRADDDECVHARPKLDLLIATLFCFSYFTLSETTSRDYDSQFFALHAFVSLAMLCVAVALAALYEVELSQLPKHRLFWLSALPGTGAVMCLFWPGTEVVPLAFTAVLAGCYWYFFYYYECRSAYPSQNDSIDRYY